jgi:hypothetical protein
MKSPPKAEAPSLWDEVLSTAPPTVVVDETHTYVARPDIAGIQREQLALAETAAHITDEAMKACFYAQFKAVSAESKRLEEWLKADEAREGWEESQAWHRTYQRAGYLSETLRLLVERHHVLICPNCGNGAPAGSDAFEEGPSWWEAISLRGLLTGEGALSWQRYCEPCQRDTLRAQADVKWRGTL